MTAKKSIIPVFIPHLGCSHECVFCNQKRISGSLLPALPGDVAKLLKASKAKGAALAFYGGSFTALSEAEQIAFLKAAQPFLQDGTIAEIRLSTRPDCISEQGLALLKAYGVKTIELGAQSMDDAVLAVCSRGHTAQDTRNAAALVKAHGFELGLQMMTGLCGASAQSDEQTAREIASLSPDAVRIYPAVVIKDTRLAELFANGDYAQHTVAEAVELCARILPIFEAAEIPVIRLGLNPTEELSGGVAIAGAYHPAFGELVKGRIFLEKARALMTEIPSGSEAVLRVNPSCVSQMAGQRRCNIKALLEEFSLAGLKICADEIKCGEIRIEIIAKQRDL